MCTTTAWCSNRFRNAVTMAGSPNNSPHSAKPQLGVRIMAPRSCRALTSSTTGPLRLHPHHVADLIDDRQLGAAEITDALPQAILIVGLGEAVDDVGHGAEIHAAPGADCLHPESDGQVTFTGTGQADEMHHLVLGNELQAGQILLPSS